MAIITGSRLPCSAGAATAAREGLTLIFSLARATEQEYYLLYYKKLNFIF